MPIHLPSAEDAWLETPEGRLHRIGRACVIGRLGSCNVVLGDESVSRKHARIRSGPKGGHTIMDLGSTNGTYVNGLKIAEATPLRDRDTIGLGSCRLKYRKEQAVSEMATEVRVAAPPAYQHRVLVATDASLEGDGLLRSIDGQPDLRVDGHATNARQALQMYGRLRPDIVLLDASTNGVGAFSLLTDLMAADPDARIVALLARPDPDYINRTLRRGALACVLKTDPAVELIRALQSAAAGSVYLSRRIAAVTVKQLAGSKEGGRRDGPQVLTNRELEIFHLIGGAKANREIAASLGMSVKTVETHKENIKIKLGVANSAELSERAREWLAR